LVQHNVGGNKTSGWAQPSNASPVATGRQYSEQKPRPYICSFNVGL